MLHYIVGQVQKYSNKIFIQNNFWGVEAQYFGNKKEGEFFLYPHIDDNKKTITYFAFDNIEQKISFENILKVSGIGPKTAFQIAAIPRSDLQQAIKTLDTKFFQSIPGIGPKSAKKIILELKGNFELSDLDKIDIDQKLYKNIVSSMKGLGYDTSSIKETLQKYDGKISKNNMAEVIKRVISKL